MALRTQGRNIHIVGLHTHTLATPRPVGVGRLCAFFAALLAGRDWQRLLGVLGLRYTLLLMLYQLVYKVLRFVEVCYAALILPSGKILYS
jgi:hypothetical protein